MEKTSFSVAYVCSDMTTILVKAAQTNTRQVCTLFQQKLHKLTLIKCVHCFSNTQTNTHQVCTLFQQYTN